MDSVIFKIDTSDLIPSVSLHLSCAVSAPASSCTTCETIQFFVYSSSPITFSVKSCYSPKTHAALSYTLGTSATITVLATDFIGLSDAA